MSCAIFSSRASPVWQRGPVRHAPCRRNLSVVFCAGVRQPRGRAEQPDAIAAGLRLGASRPPRRAHVRLAPLRRARLSATAAVIRGICRPHCSAPTDGRGPTASMADAAPLRAPAPQSPRPAAQPPAGLPAAGHCACWQARQGRGAQCGRVARPHASAATAHAAAGPRIGAGRAVELRRVGLPGAAARVLSQSST